MGADLAAASSPGPVSELQPGGYLDPVAIQAAASGARRVTLTAAERMLAAACILAAGGRQADVVRRLGVSRAEAFRMSARLAALFGPDRG